MLTQKEIRILQRCIKMADEWKGNLDPEDFDAHDEFISSAHAALARIGRLKNVGDVTHSKVVDSIRITSANMAVEVPCGAEFIAVYVDEYGSTQLDFSFGISANKREKRMIREVNHGSSVPSNSKFIGAYNNPHAHMVSRTYVFEIL